MIATYRLPQAPDALGEEIAVRLDLDDAEQMSDALGAALGESVNIEDIEDYDAPGSHYVRLSTDVAGLGGVIDIVKTDGPETHRAFRGSEFGTAPDLEIEIGGETESLPAALHGIAVEMAQAGPDEAEALVAMLHAIANGVAAGRKVALVGAPRLAAQDA